MSFERARAILVKEFKQIFRDPRMKTIIFVSPLLQIILFGYAANKDINYVPTAILDRDNTVESRELLRLFLQSFSMGTILTTCILLGTGKPFKTQDDIGTADTFLQQHSPAKT